MKAGNPLRCVQRKTMDTGVHKEPALLQTLPPPSCGFSLSIFVCRFCWLLGFLGGPKSEKPKNRPPEHLPWLRWGHEAPAARVTRLPAPASPGILAKQPSRVLPATKKGTQGSFFLQQHNNEPKPKNKKHANNSSLSCVDGPKKGRRTFRLAKMVFPKSFSTPRTQVRNGNHSYKWTTNPLGRFCGYSTWIARDTMYQVKKSRASYHAVRLFNVVLRI